MTLVTPRLFSRYVKKALEDLPEEFRTKLENVEVLIEDFADDETLDSLGIESPFDLLGLYVGVPITHQSVFSANPLPDRIFLYRIPVLQGASDKDSVIRKIRQVVIHEVGHHFGFDDDQLERIEGETD
jgi:predicted Zn-dependent protease with MMP-like domain